MPLVFVSFQLLVVVTFPVVGVCPVLFRCWISPQSLVMIDGTTVVSTWYPAGDILHYLRFSLAILNQLLEEPAKTSQKNRHKRTVTTNHHSQPSQPTATVNRHSQTSTGRAIGSDHVEEPLYVRVLRTLFSTYPSKPNLKLGFC